MKKIAIILVLALALSLSATAFSAPFVDVPAGHWAEEYLQRVVEVGIITGFPDGTFRGNEPLTRYQIATVTARVMDWALEVVGDELHDFQAKLMRELRQKGLTDAQAEEVLIMVRALTLEFRDDIAALEKTKADKKEVQTLRSDLMVLMGEHFDLEFHVLQLEDKVDDLDARVDEDLADLQERVAALEEPEPKIFSLSMSTEFDFLNVQTYGPGVAYKNPYATHFRHPVTGAWVSDHWTTGYDFEHTVTWGLTAARDEVTVDLSLEGLTNFYGHGAFTDYDVELSDLRGTVETPDFLATFNDDQYLSLKSYAYGHLGYLGMDMDYNRGLLVLGTDGVADDYTAYTYEYGFFDFIDGRFFATVDDVLMDTREYVLGLENNFSIIGLDVNTEFAMSDVESFDEYLFKLGLAYGIDFWDIGLGFNYKLASDDFDALRPHPTAWVHESGFDASLALAPFGASIEGWYMDYEHNITGVVRNRAGGLFDFSQSLGPVDITLGTTYEHDLDVPEMFYHDRLAELGVGLGDLLSVTGTYSYADGSAAGLAWWDPVKQPANVLPAMAGAHHVATGVVELSPIDNFTGTANLTYDIDTGDFMHYYTAEASVAFVTADVVKYFNFRANALEAHVRAEPSFEAMGFTIMPHGLFGYRMADPDYTGMRYRVGLDLERDVTEELFWHGGYFYEVRPDGFRATAGAPPPPATNSLPGSFSKFATGVNYNDFATLDFEWGAFKGEDPAQDYEFKVLKGGISFTF